MGGRTTELISVDVLHAKGGAGFLGQVPSRKLKLVWRGRPQKKGRQLLKTQDGPEKLKITSHISQIFRRRPAAGGGTFCLCHYSTKEGGAR